MISWQFIKKASRQIRGYFAAEQIHILPHIGPISKYSGAKLGADIRAAGNVTLLALPQAIAYAAIAGLDVIYGLVSAAIAAMIAPFFASSRYNVLGPTNATAFMLFSFFSVNSTLQSRIPELLPLLVLLIALCSLIGAVLKVADLLQYVSRSVLVGYMAGAAVLIIGNQLKPLLGLDAYVNSEKTATFFGLVVELVISLVHTNWVPLVIGSVTFLIYYAFRRWKKKWPAFSIALVLGSAIFGPLIHFNVGPLSQPSVSRS